jgi:hypothetical protein
MLLASFKNAGQEVKEHMQECNLMDFQDVSFSSISKIPQKYPITDLEVVLYFFHPTKEVTETPNPP